MSKKEFLFIFVIFMFLIKLSSASISSINLISPSDRNAYISTNMSFQFEVIGDQASYFCTLYIDNEARGDVTANNNTITTIYPNQTLSNGNNTWWITCEETDSIYRTVYAGGHITNCANLVESGNYYLDNDIITSTSDICIKIKSNHLSLDCKKHIIKGNDTGVAIGGTITDYRCAYDETEMGDVCKDIDIYNCEIINFSKGIALEYLLNSNLYNNTLLDNYYGIYTTQPSCSNIYSSKFVGNTYGLRGFVDATSSYCKIYNNFFNNTNDFFEVFFDTFTIDYNTTKKRYEYKWNASGELVLGIIGGNFWAKPDGTGYSETCQDADQDGFCDYPYDVKNNRLCETGVNCSDNTDYLPYSIYEQTLGSPYYFNSVNWTEDKTVLFNITWSDQDGFSIDNVIIKFNISNQNKTYTMTLIDPYISQVERKGVYHFNISARELTTTPGIYTWRSIATSNDGVSNVSEWYVFELTEDMINAPPRYSNIWKTPEPYTYPQNINFQIDWIDPDGNNINVTFELCYPEGYCINHTTDIQVNGNIYYINISSFALPAGNYNFTWYAVDNKSAWNKTSTISFTINKGTPQINYFINEIQTNLTSLTSQAITIKLNETNYGDNDITYCIYNNSYQLACGSPAEFTGYFTSKVFKITFNNTEGQNWTSNEKTYYIFVFKNSSWIQDANHEIIFNGTENKTAYITMQYNITNPFTETFNVSVSEIITPREGWTCNYVNYSMLSQGDNLLYLINCSKANTLIGWQDENITLYSSEALVRTAYHKQNITGYIKLNVNNTIPDVDFVVKYIANISKYPYWINTSSTEVQFTAENGTTSYKIVNLTLDAVYEKSFISAQQIPVDNKNQNIYIGEIVVRTNDIKNIPIRYRIPKGRLPDWDNRLSDPAPYSEINGSSVNVTILGEIVPGYIDVVVGPYHGNSSLEAGTYYWKVIYYTQRTSSGSQTPSGPGPGPALRPLHFDALPDRFEIKIGVGIETTEYLTIYSYEVNPISFTIEFVNNEFNILSTDFQGKILEEKENVTVPIKIIGTFKPGEYKPIIRIFAKSQEGITATKEIPVYVTVVPLGNKTLGEECYADSECETGYCDKVCKIKPEIPAPEIPITTIAGVILVIVLILVFIRL